MKPKKNSTYNQLKPTKALKGFVDSYFESNNLTSQTLHRTIFPDSFFKLIITLINGEIANIFITGLWTIENKIEIPPNSKTYGIKFKILAPEYVFNREIASLIQSVDFMSSNFWGINKLNLNSLQVFVKQIEPIILKQIANNKIESKKIALSQLLYYKNGNILVREISKKTNWSSRSINRYFTKYLGIPLKSYLNIQKIYTAYILIIDKNFFPENGFHDQSHFIREVKKYTNKTPKELEKEKHDRFIQLKNIQK